MTAGREDARHPVQELDDVVHQRVRLGILAVLREADKVEFGYLRDLLNLTDGNLSRHLQTLEEVGYVDVEKGYQGRRPRTWVTISRMGSHALERELSLLRALVARLDASAEGS